LDLENCNLAARCAETTRKTNARSSEERPFP
jgi:hypothetical protein